MANYSCTIRTNYFHVKDPEKFRELMSRVCGSENPIDLWEDKDSDGSPVFGFGVYGSISGLCSTQPIDGDEDADIDEDDDEDASYDDFLKALQEYIADGDAVIILESGHENMKYVIGLATVVTSTSCEYIDITTLAEKQARLILNDPDWTTKCEY